MTVRMGDTIHDDIMDVSTSDTRSTNNNHQQQQQQQSAYAILTRQQRNSNSNNAVNSSNNSPSLNAAPPTTTTQQQRAILSEIHPSAVAFNASQNVQHTARSSMLSEKFHIPTTTIIPINTHDKASPDNAMDLTMSPTASSPSASTSTSSASSQQLLDKSKMCISCSGSLSKCRKTVSKTYNDKSSFSGDICSKTGRRWGRGVFINRHQDKYEGEWMDDKRSGYGMYLW
jgi:hypothetical protein